MASSVSAKKRMRQNDKNRTVNRAIKSKIKSGAAKLDKMLAEGADATTVKAQSVSVVSTIDKACKTGVIHKNTASRKKSKAMKKTAAALKKA